jgi:Tfp pilus assembly protein PilE
VRLEDFSVSRARSISVRRAAQRPRSPSVLELGLIAIVLAIALAVVIPGYVHLRQESRDDSARTLLVDATRVLDRHRATAGTYRGAALPAGVEVAAVTKTSYCVETRAGDQSWHASGPYGAKPVRGACPAP